MNKKRKIIIDKSFTYFAITVITALLNFPFLWMLTTSLKDSVEMFSANPTFLPKDLTFTNYIALLKEYKFFTYFKNSVIVSISTTLVALLFATFMAYGISRFKFRGKNVISSSLILTQMFPLPLIIITIYVTFVKLGLFDTRLGLVIAYCTFALPFCTMMLRSYFDGLPVELEEAAAIDGCGPFSTIFRIVIPLASPSIVAMGLFAFILSWQELMMSMTLVHSTALRTMPVAITMMVGVRNIMWGPLMAASVIVSIPVVILFIYFQKYLISGMTMGAVKG
ncbi:MAG: carbohydrate ABC transporter permease [Anaerolineaceae bacterium]|nr:MAG: carbohydrate ABC transporter permease [Anaerolineaceae bacterium]